MMIQTMPDVLRWSDGTEVLATVHDSYVALLSDRLGGTLAALRRSDERLVDELRELISMMPDDAFLRFLTAPETSCRLLWPGHHPFETVGAFFRDAVTAELVRAGRPLPTDRVIWTPLGDARIEPGGEIVPQPVLDGLMPLDFGSPYALRLDLEGRVDAVETARRPYEGDELRLVLDRLAEARDGIAAVDRGVLDFVAIFNKVLIPQRDTDAPEMFSSGSQGQYVGRSVLGNPHLAKVDAADIADAIIHEGIHALLYMQEQRRPWVLDPSLYEHVHRTHSPWTGNPLPLRPYMQASFVWYGLLNFWCMALGSDAFPAARVRARISQAALGFLGAPLVSRIEEFRDRISPELIEAMETMQEVVGESFAAAL